MFALPVPFVTGAGDACAEYAISLIVGVRRELIAVENNFGFGKCRNDSAHGGAIAAKRGTGAAEQFANIEAIDATKAALQKFAGNFETDERQV